MNKNKATREVINKAKMAKLMTKIDKYTEARRVAEAAFYKLRVGSGTDFNFKNWDDFCKDNGLSRSVDFGDLTC